jgi:hypothetical protein
MKVKLSRKKEWGSETRAWPYVEDYKVISRENDMVENWVQELNILKVGHTKEEFCHHYAALPLLLAAL